MNVFAYINCDGCIAFNDIKAPQAHSEMPIKMKLVVCRQFEGEEGAEPHIIDVNQNGA